MCLNKNICIITEEFRPSLKGGIATWSTELANYLHKKKYKVTVFVKKHGGIDKLYDTKRIPYKIKLIPGRDWAFFKKWYIMFSLFGYLKNNKKPIIISTNWELSQGLIIYKTFLKFSLVTILHGLEVTRLKSKKYKKRVKSFKKTLKYSDLIISVSNYTKAKAKSIINLNLEIHVIPNFVNMETFQPVDRKNFLNDYGLSNDDIILLSLSRLVRRKGHHIIIESLKDLTKNHSNIKYLIAGTGDKNYEQELREYVEKLNLQKNINFLGYVNEQKKKIIYNMCDVFLMTSLPTDHEGNSEGFGITFLEANACGKPVIGTNVGGIPDVIKDGNNGFLIEPNNPRELQKTIEKIINDKNYYNFLSKNSIKHIKENFDINLIGKKFDLLIDRLYDSH